MALARQTPKCPFCGKVIAKAVIKTRSPWQPPIFGDNFDHWEYKRHKCKKAPKLPKEDDGKWKDIFDKILNKK